MLSNRARKRASISRAAALIAFGITPSAWAANLLINPGFESPTVQATESPTATGWNFYANAERAGFQAHTGSWSDWERDFEVAGGVTQTVGNIVAGTPYSLSAYQYFEPNFSTLLTAANAYVDFELTWENSSGSTVGTPNILIITAASNPPTSTWTQYTLSGTTTANTTDSNLNPVVAPTGATQVVVSFDYRASNASNGAYISSYVDDVDLEGAGIPPTVAAWALSTSGDWNLPGDWSTGNIPNGPGQEADFFGAISASRNVYSDLPIIAGTLNFNNAFTYVIDGAGSLTLQASTGNAQVIVQQGFQEINLPLTIASNTVFNISSGSALVIADPILVDANKSVTQIGGGSVTYESTITLQTGASLAIQGPTHAASLEMQGNSVTTIAPHTGSTPTILELDGLAVAGSTNNWTSTLDITNNEVILTNGNLASTTNQVKQGLIGAAGIISSTAKADSSHLTAIGVIQNDNGSGVALYPTFGTVSGLTNTAVLVKYTYFGDTNLDGKVDGSDYSRIDNGYLSHLSGWYNGDFNYDGVVDGSDYALIDNAFNRQGPVLPDTAVAEGILAGSTAQIAAVPEPASLGLVALGVGSLLTQRRRRQ